MDQPDDAGLNHDNEVAHLLTQLGLEKYIPLFFQHEFETVSRLLLVTDADLCAMGMRAIGARRHLLSALAEIAGQVNKSDVSVVPPERRQRRAARIAGRKGNTTSSLHTPQGKPSASFRSLSPRCAPLPRPVTEALYYPLDTLAAVSAKQKGRVSASFRSSTPRLAFNQPSREALLLPGPGENVDIPGIADLVQRQARYRSSSAPVVRTLARRPVVRREASPPPGAYDVKDPRSIGYTDSWLAQRHTAAFRSTTPRQTATAPAVCPTTGYTLPDAKVKLPHQR
eukprot:TRINITY_DN24436_c0_g1_i3.p1 TRINITY_DN24436_c0_g1~~TRINITY_DN24436_c0_g1_i3.p1  ORF type:complete len:283 (-),score=13.42 TRINITY_DN24436_c0_g1_i3:295-1143(-)